jgi:hypothetical protein
MQVAAAIMGTGRPAYGGLKDYIRSLAAIHERE